MARKGRFGHLPPAAPDLSATIVSLYEQYENQRDRDIIDAWQNGGEFEGKPVTDDRILQWFQMRREQMDKSDPMWDYWNDQYQQTRFHIAEQKANLDYTRHQREEPVSANQKMADFYRKWARELPRDSAAWRDLMTSAAKFASAARAAAAAGRAGSRTAALAAAINNITKTQIAPAERYTQTIYDAAARMGFLDANDQGQFSFSVTEAEDFNQLLAAVNAGGAGVTKGPYVAPSGATYTPEELAQVRDWIENTPNVPDWKGTLSVDDFIKKLDRAADGYRQMAKVYDRYGEHSSAKTARGYARKYDAQKVRMKVVQADIPDKYLTLRQGYESDRRNAHDPFELTQINAEYADRIDELSAQTGRLGDAVGAGKLLQEAVAARGGTPTGDKSYYEDWSGTQGGSSAGTGPDLTEEGTGTSGAKTELQALAFSAQKAQQDAENLASGNYVMVITKDRNSPTGETTNVVPRSAATTLLGDGNPTTAIVHAHDGATFYGADGTSKALESGTYDQIVSMVPVVVDVPMANDPDQFVGGGTFNSSLQGITTRKVGYRVDYGGGHIGWVSLNADGSPGGVTDIPPYIETPGAIHSQGLDTSDNAWHVQYNTPWLMARSAPPPGVTDTTGFNPNANEVDSFLKFVQTDPTGDITKGNWMVNVQKLINGEPVLDANLASTDQFLPPPTPPAEADPNTVPSGQTPTLNRDTTSDNIFMGTGPDGKPIYMPNPSKGQPANDVPVPTGKAPFGSQEAAMEQQGLDINGQPLRDTTGQDAAAAYHHRNDYLIQPPHASNPPPPVTGTIPIPVSAEEQRAKAQALADAHNNAVLAAFATDPVDLHWANSTLYFYASSPDARQELSKSDPVVIWKEMAKIDPRLNDPTSQAYQQAAGQMDMLRSAGSAGQAQAEFAVTHILTGGIGLGSLVMANLRNNPAPDMSMTSILAASSNGVDFPTVDQLRRNQPAPYIPDSTPESRAAMRARMQEQRNNITNRSTLAQPQINMPGPESAGAPAAVARPVQPNAPAGVTTPAPGAPKPVAQPTAPQPTVLTPIKPVTPKPPEPPKIKVPKPPTVTLPGGEVGYRRPDGVIVV